MERLAGPDATLLHLQRPGVPTHTLKTVVLDSSGLGRQLTLDDLRGAFLPRLGLLPRATQRLVAAPGFPARPFWVSVDDFDLDAHLDEVTLPAPGGREQLDAVHSELMARPLDLDRPLWAATLVHGLADGRQALVVRVHHAVADGLGALNSLLRLTTDDPGTSVPTAPAELEPRPPAGTLRRHVLREALTMPAGLWALVRDGGRGRREVKAFRAAHPDLPPAFGAKRAFTSVNGPRLCTSHEIDFERVRAVSSAAGVSVNGVYHAMVAAAMRDELLSRGEHLDEPTTASFGVSADVTDASRVSGNQVSPTVVRTFSNLSDPLERLRETARSCREGVELRKLAGHETSGRWATYTCRLVPVFVNLAADRVPRVVNHVTTANVPGPRTTRFAGPVAVVDWKSFVFNLHPTHLNVTAYSYRGVLSIGMVTNPNVLPEPREFLLRMEAELDVLEDALGLSTGRADAGNTFLP